MKYRPEIDGLRALAVIPVILFHAGFSLFGGGYVGVDIFFVISGYLITSIILRDLELGKFSLLNFYERRARRILPALYFVFFITAVAAWFLMLPNEFANFSLTIVSVSLFFSNIFFWKHVGYFAPHSEVNPLIHSWSLSVEEQFYVFFPLLLFFLFRWRKDLLLYAISIFAILSFALTEFVNNFISVSGSSSFFLAPTRAWELLVGSICALVISRFKPASDNFLAALGIIFVVLSVFIYDEHTPFPSFYTLLPVIGSALIIIYGEIDTVVGRLLAFKYLVLVGLISYSAYLWHQPLFAFFRLNSQFDSSYQIKMLVLSALSLVLAYYTWLFIESPFRKKDRVSRRSVLVLSVGATLLFVVFGLHSHFNNGYENLWLKAKSKEYKQTYNLTNISPHESNFRSNENGLQDNGKCIFSVTKFGSAEIERLNNCFDEYGPGVAVLGDSHAIDLFGVATSNTENQFVFGLTIGGCAINDVMSQCYFEEFKSLITSNPNLFSFLLYEQASFRILTFEDRPLDGNLIELIPITKAYPEVNVNEAEVLEVVQYLNDIAKYTPVIWFGPRIEPRISRRVLLSYSCDQIPALRSGQEDFYKKLDTYLINLMAERSDIVYLSQNQSFNLKFPNDLITCEHNYWADGHHLSTSGEVEFGKRFNIIDFGYKKFNLVH